MSRLHRAWQSARLTSAAEDARMMAKGLDVVPHEGGMFLRERAFVR